MDSMLESSTREVEIEQKDEKVITQILDELSKSEKEKRK